VTAKQHVFMTANSCAERSNNVGYSEVIAELSFLTVDCRKPSQPAQQAFISGALRLNVFVLPFLVQARPVLVA
jgi:hypothetical protein